MNRRHAALNLTALTLTVLTLVGPSMAGLIPPAVAAADDYPRNPDVDVVHYAFHIELSDATDEIHGKARIRVAFRADGVDEVWLDLVGRRPGGEAGMTVTDAREGDRAIAWAHRDDRLVLRLPEPSVRGEQRLLSVEYGGKPADGLIISENRHGDRTFFGDNWPDRARHWLPTVDHVSDKATVEWTVDAPAHYQVVGNGRLTEETDLAPGARRTRWATEVPIPTKVMVIGAARFAVEYLGEVAGVPLQSWVYPEDRDPGFHDYAIAERVLRFFEGHIGPFPYAKLANVQSRTRYGGMENASNIFYSERSVTGDRSREGLIAHEVAHQWFGDSVTELDWHHIWLSEGFATYFSQLYMEYTYGRDRLVEGMRAARQRVIRTYRQSPDLAVVAPSIDDLNELLNGNSYQKGGWVLHMLRKQVGDVAFWEGIRRYYREFRDSNALTEDFERVMEDVSGQELGWFFQQWIFIPGHPRLEGIWSWDATTRNVALELRQTQPGPAFRAPLELGIFQGGAGRRTGPRIETVQLDEATETYTFRLDAEPTEVVLDPETWLLMEGEITRRRPRQSPSRPDARASPSADAARR